MKEKKKKMFDIVYTYVNGDDPTHIQSKREAMNVCAPEPESSHVCRFYSSCEIIFSLFSIFLFMSHDELHKIYIVISDHSYQMVSFEEPEWIRTHQAFQQFIQSKIVYVTHSQIIPLEFLPTFNSHVIELYLSNIPGLLEMFVYFNDDCFLGAPVSQSFFFEEKTEKANIFPSSSQMKSSFVKGQQNALSQFQTIMNKTFDLLQQRFIALRTSRIQWNKCHHQAKALLKSSCQSVLKDDVFHNAIVQLSSRKFRTRQDFSPIELMIGYLYFTGKGQPLDAKPYTFYIEWTQDQTHMQTKFEALLQRQSQSSPPILICINDIPFETKNETPPMKRQPVQRRPTMKTSEPAAGEQQAWKAPLLSQFAYQYFAKAMKPTQS